MHLEVMMNLYLLIIEARFCILVDEAKDAPNKKQIAIFKRFLIFRVSYKSVF
jgi:hypothetical protein